MKNDFLQFYTSLRHTSTLDLIQKEFSQQAELLSRTGSSEKEMVIIDEELEIAITFNSYLVSKSQQASKDILEAIEKEMDDGAFNGEKKANLKSYISEILLVADKLKHYFHLKHYAFLSDHLTDIIQNLKTHYLPESGLPHQNEEAKHITAGIKLKWTGGVAALATLFHELRTARFDIQVQPFLNATPKQLEIFLLNNFVDENDEQFSPASLATYLDPSKPEKKAKRNKVPTDQIFKRKSR